MGYAFATVLLGVAKSESSLASTPTPTPSPITTPAATLPVCGTSSSCQCGDTVVGQFTMTTDLTCNGAGLMLSTGAVLDCAGHTITGPGGATSQFGILISQATGATIRNCRVTGFRRGVRLSQGSGNHVENVEAFANGDLVAHTQGGYGIDIGSSTDNVIDSCNVHDNADEGIHVGGGSDRTTVLNTTSMFNYREQLYVLNNSGTVLTGNRLQGSQQTSSAALFLKGVTGTQVSQNGIWNGNLEIRGGSTGIVIQDTLQISSGIRFVADGTSIPSGNTVLRSQIDQAFECVRSNSAVNNSVVDCEFQSCTSAGVVETSSVTQPAETTLVGSRPPSPTNLDQNSTLHIVWHLNVTAKDSLGQPVAGADVTITDRYGKEVLQTQTAADGTIATADLLSRIGGSPHKVFSPFKVVVSKPGVGMASAAVFLTKNRAVSLVLQ
jgi:parallel beta-helix repeat protein